MVPHERARTELVYARSPGGSKEIAEAKGRVCGFGALGHQRLPLCWVAGLRKINGEMPEAAYPWAEQSHHKAKKAIAEHDVESLRCAWRSASPWILEARWNRPQWRRVSLSGSNLASRGNE
jgi:hypothetical protein